MTDQEWKLKVVSDLSALKQDVKHILKNLPICEKEVIKSKIKLQRSIVYFLLFTYIPLLVAIVAKIN